MCVLNHQNIHIFFCNCTNATTEQIVFIAVFTTKKNKQLEFEGFVIYHFSSSEADGKMCDSFTEQDDVALVPL